MRALKNENNNFQYILTVIDVFSKKAWAFKLKDKKGSSVLEALKVLFKSQHQQKFMLIKEPRFLTKIVKNF